MSKDLICPLDGICDYYNRYIVIYEKGKINPDEDVSKVIRLDGGDKYFCGALRAIHREDEQENLSGKDCALIKLLNNTNALLHLSDKTSL